MPFAPIFKVYVVEARELAAFVPGKSEVIAVTTSKDRARYAMLVLDTSSEGSYEFRMTQFDSINNYPRTVEEDRAKYLEVLFEWGDDLKRYVADLDINKDYNKLAEPIRKYS